MSIKSIFFYSFYVSKPAIEEGRVTVADRPENWLVDVPGEGKTCFDRGSF